MSQRIPFKVYGFVRSGNHLLAATLQRAFFPDLPPRIVERNSGTGHWSQRRGPAAYLVDGKDQGTGGLSIPYGAILGTHVLPGRRINPKAVVYIMRDGRDTLLSCYNWPKLRRPDQEGMTFSEFIRAPIDWRGTPGFKVDPVKGYTIVHHWRDHVAAWAKAGVLLVRYEGVARLPRRAVQRVANRFGLASVERWQSVGPVGWEPSGGFGVRAKVGTWRHEWSRRDLDFFDRVVGKKFIGRYDIEPETDYWMIRHKVYPDIRAVGHCGRSTRHNEEVYAQASRQLEDMLRADTPSSVLDVGYGQGHHSKTCKRAGVPAYVGIDSVSLKRLRMGGGYRFRTVDAGEPFNLNQKFDVVMLIDMAYHVVADDRFASLIENVKRHARKAVYVTGLFEDLPNPSEKSLHWYCRHRGLESFLPLGKPGPLVPWRDSFIVRLEVRG